MRTLSKSGICGFLAAAFWVPQAFGQNIVTIAGGGSEPEDGMPAISTFLAQPAGLTFDPGGDLIFSELRTHLVRRIDAQSSVVTTLAGTGEAGSGGDNGPAADAGLSAPFGVASDSSGNLFVADFNNHRVRRIDAVTSLISTVAGTGDPAFNGDGMPATLANIGAPLGVAVDGNDNLLIADAFNQRVRRVDANTGIMTTVAGNGLTGISADGIPATQASLDTPAGVIVDPAGNLYFSEFVNNRVRRVRASDGSIDTVAGIPGGGGFAGDGGPAVSALFNAPTGLALDGNGQLFVADSGNQRVRRVDLASGIISTYAGNGEFGFSGDGGAATDGSLSLPLGLAVDTTNRLYIADASDRIRRVRTDGTIETFAGRFPEFFSCSGTAVGARLLAPTALAEDADGNLYLSDALRHVVQRIDAVTGFIDALAGTGESGFAGDGFPADQARLNSPAGLATDAQANVYIADSGNHRIRMVRADDQAIRTIAGNGTAGYSGDGGPADSAALREPGHVTVDPGGNVFISDTGNHVIRRIDKSTGMISTVAGTGSAGFSGDGGPATQAALNGPIDLAVDADGNLFIADADNHRIRRVDATTGIIATVAGTGLPMFSGDGNLATDAALNTPAGIALSESGSLWIADLGNHRIREVDLLDGIIGTRAGTGDPGFDGDGGPALQALLNSPFDVLVDRGGSPVIADLGNGRVRRIESGADSLPAPPDLDSGDRLGSASAISGNLLAVGIPNDAIDAQRTGSVAIYTLNGCRVQFETKLTAPIEFSSAGFGRALAMDGATLVVGGSRPAAGRKGSLAALQAAIFERLESGWTLKSGLSPQGADQNDDFGAAVALDAGVAVVGAPDDAEGEEVGSGAVYLYRFSADNIDPAIKMKSQNPQPGQRYGASAAADRGRLIVGSPGGPVGAALSGSVDLYDRIRDNLVPLGSFGIGTPAAGDKFGAAVAISGTTTVVGAPGRDTIDADSGMVFEFDFDNAGLMRPIAPSDSSQGAAFGTAVGVGPAGIFVGAPGVATGVQSTGAVYQFGMSQGGISQVDRIAPSAAHREFGSALSVSGHRILIGAPATAADRGDAALRQSSTIVFSNGYES